ncbi:HET domain-containing protein [Fusarium keratoplasticum]|uniref:HET domain-containing protein n=1 Tax=Fusarium keratoplasticum TaxID=1328300 RepID=A0ACC0R3V2_9HYPO|nr:HET domain-containing protein [Fusarium keratoplasticum]KAI8671665.1 HET domain-containing protein [Fusarium keratoplasticum]
MARSKSHPWFDQVLMLNEDPCKSCGALCDLFEKPSSTGEYVPGGDFEIKSRGKNVILNHQDICETCLALAKAAIILRMSLYREGISDPKPLLAKFWDVRVSENVINATVSWLLRGATLLTQKSITICQPKDASASISIDAAKEDRSTARSEQNISFIRKMLSLCETGQDCHHNCKSGGDRILPTRLVLIGDGESSIRLHETSKEQQGSYAALSHCWGPPEKHPLRTLQGNIESMKSKIPGDKLSVVFKESIWLCRQLGIKYIWIDSLCIVQDDATEWEIEAAKMAQYYSEARITIAVDSSPDGTTSFLSQRAERWHPQTSSSAPYLIVREHYDRLQEDDLENSSIKAHKFLPETHHLLPTRAWAMQESILSTRIVRFTLSDITWEWILEAHCETSKDSPFGRVKSGYLLIKAPLFKVTLTYSWDSIPEDIVYEVVVAGDDENEEPWASDSFTADCLLSVKKGNALRAYDGDNLEYMTNPTSFTATAWVMWLGIGALVLGQDPDSEAFQRLGYLDTYGEEVSSPIGDPERWTNSLQGTVVQFQLV